jgi:hypothetical protein
MVMDPSMASGPITIAAWTGMMAPEQFHEVPLAGVQELIKKAPNNDLSRSAEAVNHPMTFTADRNNMVPNDVGKVGAGGPGTTANTPADANNELQGGMPTLKFYAQLAPFHELAAAIREKLPGTPASSKDIVDRVRSFASTPEGKMALAYFADPTKGGTYSGNFHVLVADMRKKLTPAAMGDIDQLINEGNTLLAAQAAGGAAGGASGATH